MSNPLNPLSEILAACEQLRLAISEQQHQIEELTRQNEKLRQEAVRLAEERELFWKLSGQILAEESRKYDSQIEAEITEGMNDSVEFGGFLLELEQEFSSREKEARDAG